MNKLLRRQMETRHNNLWIGMYTDKKITKEKTKSLSYRMKAEQRDRLKLEREDDLCVDTTTTRT